jgi:hypothetical protein
LPVVAWDIRGTPDLQEAPGDVLAVMHLHVDNLDIANGHTYLGVQFASFFHARELYLQHGQRYRAVNWNTGNQDPTQNINARAGVVECDRNSDDRWWVGDPRANADPNDPVTRLGFALVQQGIINDNLLAGMFDPTTYHADRNGRLFDSWGFDWEGQTGQARLATSYRVPVPTGGQFLPGNFPLFQQPAPNQPYGGGDPIRKRLAEALGGAWERAWGLVNRAVKST